MKAFLMFRDRDFDLQQTLPPNEQELTQDLELNTLFDAMALDDDFLREAARKAVLQGVKDPQAIRYRQDILKDCLNNPDVVRDIYRIPIESIANKRRHWMGIFSYYPGGVLSNSIELMQMFMTLLRKLKHITDEHSGNFASEGFTAFFAMIRRELDDDYFAVVDNHLRELRFRDGALLSARLGPGNEGADYLLRKPHPKDPNWIKRIISWGNPVYSFRISDRDESGARALSELEDIGINLVANALAQSADHIDSFFNMLRMELAFYVGCINLYEQLAKIGEAVSYPLPVAPEERRHSFHGLYDVCLALTKKQKTVGNDADADNKDLVIITGANQGGKSTFLRSVGLAQLMMQCGMFAPAEYFNANISDGIFTHFKRKEDASMKSGKLDEELSRMSIIADVITSNSLALFNESFAATNEREGSEIARQITCALLEKRVKVFYVTHQYKFAHDFHENKMENAIFLRAERRADGGRTYKVIEGEPLQTSYGKDLYDKIFGTVV